MKEEKKRREEKKKRRREEENERRKPVLGNTELRERCGAGSRGRTWLPHITYIHIDRH